MQTAPATVFTLMVPYLLAGGRDPATIAALFALGHLVHFFSFGHNSLMDYWHDLKDPSKRHHPLVSGAISFESACKVIHYGSALTAVALVALSLHKSTIALAPLILYVVFGHAYNDGLDHSTKHSWIPICTAFTSLAAASWMMHECNLDAKFAITMSWAFLTLLYQIAYEGNVKDLWNPAEVHNPLKRYAEVSDQRLAWVDARVSALFIAVRGAANTAALVALAILFGCSADTYVMLSALTALEIEMLRRMHFKLPVDRHKLLEYMGVAEATEFFRLASILGAWGIPLIAYGLAYFISMNRLLWGTRFGPRV